VKLITAKRSVFFLLALPLAAASVRIYQTNSAGDAVDIIDPATNKVVMQVKDIEAPHGVTFSPDGTRAYITVEAENTVWFTDTRTAKLIGKVGLSGHPNNIAVSKDGKRLFIAIVTPPGAVDVIDTVAMKNIKSIPIKGAGHNTYVTPDGKFVIAGSVAGKSLNVIDEYTLEPVWDMVFDQGVRCMTIEKAADGSASRIFAQLSNVHGFAVIDFKTHKEIRRVMLPDEPKRGTVHSAAPSHGIGIAPDGKTLWVNSSRAAGVFAYSMPDLKPLGFVPTASTPDWLTFTPDSKTVYVANAGANYVSAVDMKAMKEVARIPVGEVPKRNGTVVIP
jgi:YVTN family beta-propeller protein